MKIVDWFVEVIEGVFIQSELVDINLTENEIYNTNLLDSECDYAVQNCTEKGTQTGKTVL